MVPDWWALPLLTFLGKTERYMANRSDWLGTVDCQDVHTMEEWHSSIPSPRQWYKFPKESLQNISCSSNTQSYTTLYYLYYLSIFQNHFLSSVKMQLTQIITILAVAVAGVAAAPGGHQPPPPPPPPPPSKPISVVQQVLSLMPLYFCKF